MGKRTSKKPPPKKPTPKLDKTFKCLYCNHEGAVTVRIKYDDNVADIDCSECKVHWNTTKITPLYDAVDVYSDWLDAAEEANKSDNED